MREAIMHSMPFPMEPRSGAHLEAAMGANLGAMRIRRGFTIPALARATHLTVDQLRAYEAGRTRVVAGDLLTIVDVLDMRISDVFAG